MTEVTNIGDMLNIAIGQAEAIRIAALYKDADLGALHDAALGSSTTSGEPRRTSSPTPPERLSIELPGRGEVGTYRNLRAPNHCCAL